MNGASGLARRVGSRHRSLACRAAALLNSALASPLNGAGRRCSSSVRWRQSSMLTAPGERLLLAATILTCHMRFTVAAWSGTIALSREASCPQVWIPNGTVTGP